MELSRIEFKIVSSLENFLHCPHFIFFRSIHANFPNIVLKLLGNLDSHWKIKYRNIENIEWKILSSKLSNSYFFQHVLNHFMRNYLWAVLENTLLTNCHTIVSIYECLYFLSSAHTHTRAHTLAREIAAKRIEETILSTGNDTRGEFPTGTRSTRL